MIKRKRNLLDAITQPPMIALAIIALGVALGELWPAEIIPTLWQYIFGRAIIAAAMLLIANAFRHFDQTNTPGPTYHTPTTLVTSGVYAITRNPTYLAMMLLVMGLGVTLDNIWLLLLAAVFQQIIRWGVIAREEKFLEAKFGEQYRTFKEQTRRWI